MTTKKMFYLLGIMFSICFQSCEDQEVIQENIGFLTYSPGYGVTEGVHVASYQDEAGGGYILLGSTDNGITKDYFIVKTDSVGNIILRNQTGERGLDNIPNKVVVKGDYIYILGDRYDRFIDRVLPYINILNLDDLSFKTDLYLDTYSGFNKDNVYQELSADFFIDEDKIIIASTIEDINGDYNIWTYIISINDIGESYFSEYDTAKTIFPGTNVKALSIQKGNDDTYYIGGTLSTFAPNDTNFIYDDEIGAGFFIIKYSYTGELLSTTYNTNVDNQFTAFLDFEVDLETENAIVLYRNENEAYLDVFQLSNAPTLNVVNNLFPIKLGEVYADDMVKYDNIYLKIIDETKSAYINKINDDYIITAIRKDDFAMIVDKRKLNGLAISEMQWDNTWEGFRITNNISSVKLHDRHNIGNAIQRVGGEGYAIIGTQDILNDTKVLLMQLDENGNYY